MTFRMPVIETVKRDVERDLYVTDITFVDDMGNRFEQPVTIPCSMIEKLSPHEVMNALATRINRAVDKLDAVVNCKAFVGRVVGINGRRAEVTSVDPIIGGETYVTVKDDDGWRIRVLWEACTCP